MFNFSHSLAKNACHWTKCVTKRLFNRLRKKTQPPSGKKKNQLLWKCKSLKVLTRYDRTSFDRFWHSMSNNSLDGLFFIRHYWSHSCDPLWKGSIICHTKTNKLSKYYWLFYERKLALGQMAYASCKPLYQTLILRNLPSMLRYSTATFREMFSVTIAEGKSAMQTV